MTTAADRDEHLLAGPCARMIDGDIEAAATAQTALLRDAGLPPGPGPDTPARRPVGLGRGPGPQTLALLRLGYGPAVERVRRVQRVGAHRTGVGGGVGPPTGSRREGARPVRPAPGRPLEVSFMRLVR